MILIKRIYKYFGFLTFIFLLNSCNTVSTLNNSIKSMTNSYKENCVSNPERCNNSELCNEAVLSGEWQTKTDYIPFVKEAKNRGLSCNVNQYSSNNSQLNQTTRVGNDCSSNPTKCSDTQLCKKATLFNNWDTRSYYKNHVSLAKQRGLSCDIIENQSKNNIDKMMKYALRRLIKLNLLSNYEVKNKEEILENMDSTEFNKFYQLCKNAFANSEPAQCDDGIKNLN